MRKTVPLLTLLVCLAMLVGCDSTPRGSSSGGAAPAGGVAVVDLDAIAKRLGRLGEIQDALSVKEEALNIKLKGVQDEARQAFDKEKEKLGITDETKPEEIGEEDQKKLRVVGRSISTQLTQAQRQAQGELSAYQRRLISKFREEVKPIAREVADQLGLSVVIPRADAFVVAFDPAVDITEAVIEKMVAGGYSSAPSGDSGGGEEDPVADPPS